jgi:site-specific DNA-methyltransferase (cytosine-N4-specific)
VGNCIEILPTLPAESVQMCVTSPPYWGGIRDYGHDAQLGLERSPSDYVDAMVGMFSLVRRVLRNDGTLWLNVGDVFAASGKGGGGNIGQRSSWTTIRERKGFRMPPPGFKMKDLTLVAFALADALRREGWYLRQTIIWRKPSSAEPPRLDRPSTSHEYLFLLARSKEYFARDPGAKWWAHSVWDIRSDADGSHPAAMPSELAERCILAGSKPGDTVLDPFGGSGTTGQVCERLGRKWILIDLNPAYANMQRARTAQRGMVFV